MRTSVDALLVLSFGGPEGPAEVRPFLENVTRGRGVPAGAAGRGRAALPALRRGQPDQRPEPGADRGASGSAPSCRSTSATATGTRWSRTPWPRWPGTASAPRWSSPPAPTAATRPAASTRRTSCGPARRSVTGRRGWSSCATSSTTRCSSRPTPTRCGPPGRSCPARSAERARLVFTAHSIPAAADATAGPPAEGGHRYSRQVGEAARLVAAELGVDDYDVVWQSRSGPPQVPWLEPDVGDHLVALHATGVPAVVVVADRLRVRSRRGDLGPRPRAA